MSRISAAWLSRLSRSESVLAQLCLACQPPREQCFAVVNHGGLSLMASHDWERVAEIVRTRNHDGVVRHERMSQMFSETLFDDCDARAD